jgi:DNA gyrase subunit A
MELGLTRKVNIDQEMQQSYLDYAMSVIVARALPDARDGLKPVQRRILYAMYDMGLRPESAYKKSARIVGEVLGKYHPHGDMAVYESMARMAQDFSMRYMLVNGQGNFGSVDGDPPAAMRYTEARLTAPAMEMLNQIDKNTVDFGNNFDETLTEPLVLPAAIPNLLVNGATGIAVGMATNIPPHNLGEVVDALVLMIEKWDKLDDISVEDLMKFIQGPDFPTGGVIIQEPQGEGLTSAYGSGRGKVIIQARAHLEDTGRGRSRIIVTELPYMVNKSSLIERIAELVRDGTLDGVTDLRDESDRQGMRIVIELNKSVEPEKVLQGLYKHTPMQSTFGINMLALVNNEPHLLSLKQALRVYVEHRLEVVRRRSEYDLEKARQRAHILEGLLVALKNLDEVIALIKASPDAETARTRLVKRFTLSEIQAQAILDMQLRRLASLERKKIDTEYKELQAAIKALEQLLKTPKAMRQAVVDELQAVKQAYGDRRRTQIVSLKEGENRTTLLTTTDVTPAQSVWVTVTEGGMIAYAPEEAPLRQSGRDAPYWLLHTNTHHTLYLVSAEGRAAAIAVHALPEAGKNGEGVSIYKASALPEKDTLVAAFTLPTRAEMQAEAYVMAVSRSGLVKKTAAADLPGPSSQPFVLAKVNDGDALGWVHLTRGKDDILFVTALGTAICFSEEEVRAMGLVAAGVGGIKLGAGDELVGVEVLPKSGEVLLLASDGKAKRIDQSDFPRQGRFGQGVVAWRLAKGLRLMGVMVGKGTARGTLHFAVAASRLIRLDEAPQRTRAGQGQPTVEVKAGDRLVALTVPCECLEFWIIKPAASRGRVKKTEAKDQDGAKP